MNFMTNKSFYQRIGRLETKNLQKLKKNVITKKEINRTAKSTTNTKIFDNESNINRDIDDTFSNFLNDFNYEAQENVPNDATITNNNGTIDYHVITAITQGRGYAQGEIGIAAIDIHSPFLLLSQFSDEFMYNGFIAKLNLLQSSEIIVPNTIFNSESKIVNSIKENFPRTKIIPLSRRHFNFDDGLSILSDLCTTECKSSIKFIEKRYYSVAAAAALLKYLKQILNISFMKNGLKIEYQTKCGRMLIDHDTCHRLELLYSITKSADKKCCLYGILDSTVTKIGKRQLRARILEPYLNAKEIQNIHKCIQELFNDPELLLLLEHQLKTFWNVDQILKLTIAVNEENKSRSVELLFDKIILLKTILDNIPELADIVRKLQNKTFQQMYKVFMDERFFTMLATINDIIRPNIQTAHGNAQHFVRINAIQSGVNKILDFSREMYSKLMQNIRDIIKDLAVKHELQLRMTYMQSKGFYMQSTLPKSTQEVLLPPDILMFHRKGNILYLTTSEIVKLNIRMTEVLNEIYEISETILKNLISNLIQYVDVNHYLIGVISELDILQSYAKLSFNDGYCCPNFGDETRIINAVHPLLEFSRTKSPLVENNIIATPEYNVFIITGPNMGGKTVYIKMIAILQILAQLGCYVPATKATFKLCDRIFTRIGYEDNIERNGSSFEIELRDIEYIFKNITPNSLVIIDELCRSTNPTNGKQISQKICEKLCLLKGLKNYNQETENDDFDLDENNTTSFEFEVNEKISNITSPFIFITTHFMHLTRLSEKFLNVVNLHVEALENNENELLKLKYTHKVKEGITPIKGYGISLAHCVNLNEHMIQRANEIFNHFTNISDESNKTSSTSETTFYLNKIFENFEKTLNNSSSHENIHNASIISKFLTENPESIVNKNSTTTTSSTLLSSSINANISTKGLLQTIQNQFYDLFAAFADIIRNDNNLEINCKKQKFLSILENLIANLPKSLINEIINDKSLKNVEEKSNDFRTWLKSYCDLKCKDCCCNQSTSSTSSSSNVNWSKLYPDMSFHSFLHKLRDGKIPIPLNFEVQQSKKKFDISEIRKSLLERKTPSSYIISRKLSRSIPISTAPIVTHLKHLNTTAPNVNYYETNSSLKFANNESHAKIQTIVTNVVTDLSENVLNTIAQQQNNGDKDVEKSYTVTEHIKIAAKDENIYSVMDLKTTKHQTEQDNNETNANNVPQMKLRNKKCVPKENVNIRKTKQSKKN